MTPEQQKAIARSRARARARARANAAQTPAASSEPESRPFIDRAADSASQFLEGVTFGATDEIQAGIGSLIGLGSYDDLLKRSRGRAKEFQDANPVVAPALEAGGAVATALTPIGAVGQAVGRPLTAANLGRSAAAGAGYGAAYGFGTGEGGAMNRAANVPINALIGAGGGVVGNAAQAGIGRVARALQSPEAASAKAMGLQPETYRIARSAAQSADADIAGGAAAHIGRGGPDAMLGDVMPGQLDYVTNVGAGRQIAGKNLGGRVDRATAGVTRAMDDTLGAPGGVRSAARDIASGTREAREAGYAAAYNTPINYADATGRQIEEVLARVPGRTLQSAVDEANEAMTAAGLRNSQILIDIAEDGGVTFREMPNVQQLDEIKKALQTMARENVDQFGRATNKGNRAKKLARELRGAIGDAVPEYNAATAAGADKIAQDEALEFGLNLLKRGTTKEIAEEAAEMAPAEVARAKQGVRAYLDDVLGNVRMARSDPNIDQREAWSALQQILTRNNKEKLRAVFGREADDMFSQLEMASRAFNVRASAAGNSATAGRQALGSQVQDAANRGRLPERLPRSIVDEALSLPGRGVNAIRGATPGRIAGRRDNIDRELAELLTGRTGNDAIATLQQLLATPAKGAVSYRPLSRTLSRASRLTAPPAVAPLIQP